LEAAGCALILGGALGNLIDRVFRRAVADWLDFHWGAAHWPAFNLADVWITLGAASIVLAGVRPGAHKAAPQRARA
jgi:signal peptidase II